MSITIETNPIPGSRSASQDETRKITFQELFRVVVTSDEVGNPVDVAKELDYSIGQTYRGFEITNLSLNETDDVKTWILTITYGRTFLFEDDPREEDWEFSITYDLKTIPVDFANDGSPITNTAHDAFAEYVQADDARCVLNARKNYKDFPFTLRDNYNTLNREEFQGAAKKTLKFEKMSVNEIKAKWKDDDITYYDVSIELAYRKEGWTKKLLNTGYRELDDEGKQKDIFIDGNPITTPVLLDVDGKKAEVGSTPHVLEFELYREVDFEELFS